jgi:hypothetical protein
MDVLLPAHVLEDLRPHRDADLAEVSLLEDGHVMVGLPDAVDEDGEVLLADRGLAQLTWQVGVHVSSQLGDQLLDLCLGAFDDFPDPFDDIRQKIQVALVSCYDTFPVPLVHIRSVIVIEEVVLAYGSPWGLKES